MPLGSPLPPPLPMPPPPRPSRLSWPRPRCLPRTIMPSTAAGRGHWAAAAGARAARSGPGGQRTQEALRGAGRGCSVRPLGGLAGTMNRSKANSQTALLVAGLPGKSLLLGCRRRRRLPGHGLVRPPERGGGVGGVGREREAGSCPSFLPLKSKSFPRGGARAASQAGSAVSHLGLGGARGLQAPRHRQAALPRDGGRGWPSGTRGHPVGISCLPLSGSGAGGGGRAEGVADAGAAESESGGSLH